MKVACIMASISRRNGGIFEAERRLNQALAAEQGVNADILGLQDGYTKADLDSWQPLVPRTFPVNGPRALGYSVGLARACQELHVDLIHAAGLWMYPSLACLRWAKRKRKPHLVTPHGMLDPWALRHSRWKKRIAGWLYENQHLQRAVCLRALCAAEAQAFRQFGLGNPVCVIPNAVDLPDMSAPQTTIAPWAGEVEPQRKVLLFLGRIHPKKGLPNLLQAWGDLRRSNCQPLRDWALAIAGWDQDGHEEELKMQARTLGIDASVCFVGPCFHEAKQAAYRNAAAFVLPSLSEGLPMAALEAMAHGLPVLITPACNLPEVFAQGAGLSIAPHPGDVERGLRELLDMSDAQRSAMGVRGRKLVAEQFTWSRVADQMRAVYDWVLGGGEPPDQVLGPVTRGAGSRSGDAPGWLRMASGARPPQLS